MWLPQLALLCAPLAPAAPFTQDASPQAQGLGDPSAEQDEALRPWLQGHAIPLGPDREGALERFVDAIGPVQVLGLGEATHGQRECFAFKRQLTLQLIARHGYRLVAYEANGTGARAANDYVTGASDDLDAALSSFGMLIWMVQENRALLEDLRAWNEGAGPADQVEFVGIDVQDAEAAARHLAALLQDVLPKFSEQAAALGTALTGARDAAYQGDSSGIPAAALSMSAFTAGLQDRWGDLVLRSSPAKAQEVLRCARELARFPLDPTDPSARDRGMGYSLLDALASRKPGTKAVLWAHNAHVTKGPLRFMGSDQSGIGGYLRGAIGDGYYCLGVVFGSGAFQALDQNAEGRWRFRRYQHGPAPSGALGHTFAEAGLSDALIDFRGAPTTGPVRTWLETPQGFRWWGGYRVPEDPDEATNDVSRLSHMVPAEDYDGLLFLKSTSAAEPVDPELLWK